MCISTGSHAVSVPSRHRAEEGGGVSAVSVTSAEHLLQLHVCMPGEGARADRTPPPHPTPPAQADCGLAKNQIMMRCLSDFWEEKVPASQDCSKGSFIGGCRGGLGKVFKQRPGKQPAALPLNMGFSRKDPSDLRPGCTHNRLAQLGEAKSRTTGS